MVSNDRTPGPHTTVEAILGHYLNFLKNSQGLADATLVLRRLHVEPFLRTLENGGVLADLRGLAPSTVHDYIIATSKPFTRASRKHLVSALRSFLRFAHVKGFLARNDRLADVCEEQRHDEEAKEFRRQSKRRAATAEVSRTVSSAGKVLRQKTQVNFGGDGLPLSELSNVAGMLRETPAMPVTRQKVGRNEPCLCGSGKRYKKCCGA